jgi:hypothetical protein
MYGLGTVPMNGHRWGDCRRKSTVPSTVVCAAVCVCPFPRQELANDLDANHKASHVDDANNTLFTRVATKKPRRASRREQRVDVHTTVDSGVVVSGTSMAGAASDNVLEC